MIDTIKYVHTQTSWLLWSVNRCEGNDFLTVHVHTILENTHKEAYQQTYWEKWNHIHICIFYYVINHHKACLYCVSCLKCRAIQN